MTDHIETFAKVDQTENGNMTRVCGRENAVRDTGEGRLGRVLRTEAMLGWGKEMIRGEVVVELTLYGALYYLGDDGDDGYGSVVVCVVCLLFPCCELCVVYICCIWCTCYVYL